MDALWVGAVVLVADILMNIWRLLASRCSSSVEESVGEGQSSYRA